MDPTDETTLSRFAAGEMDIAEENTFLRLCQERPALWRDAALAMVEHRQLVSLLSDLEDETDTTIRNPGSTNRAAHKRQTQIHWLRSIALATCLLLMVGASSWAGFAYGSFSNRPQPSNQPAIRDSSNSADQPLYLVVDENTAKTIWPQEQETSPNSDHDVLSNISQTVLSEAEHGLLRSLGYEVYEEPQLLVWADEEGTPVAMPNLNLEIRPIAHNTTQNPDSLKSDL